MGEVNDPALQEALQAIREGDKVQAFYALMAPLLGDRHRNWRDDEAFKLLTAVLSTSKGTIDGVREAQRAFLSDIGVKNPDIVSDRTLNRYLPDFGRTAQKGREIDYEPWQLECASDDALRTAFEAAVFLSGLQVRGFFIAIDPGSRPFYGKSYHYSKRHPERKPSELTSAGRNVSGAFRSTGPMYRGTVNKHDYLEMTAHPYESKAGGMTLADRESFPLCIRRGLTTKRALQDLVKVLDTLPIKPLALFVDRAFANYAKSKDLRAWCDRNEVLFVVPAVKNEATLALVTKAWHSNHTFRLRWNGDVVHWSCRPHFWRKHPTRNNLLTLYFPRDPRKDQSGDDELQRLPNGMFAVSFLINVEATAENALWIWKQYSGRWSIENLYKRYKAYCGASFSQGMFLRDYMFHAAMILMATYGLWRLHERQQGDDGDIDRRISHSRFFGSFSQQAKVALWHGQATVVKP